MGPSKTGKCPATTQDPGLRPSSHRPRPSRSVDHWDSQTVGLLVEGQAAFTAGLCRALRSPHRSPSGIMLQVTAYLDLYL